MRQMNSEENVRELTLILHHGLNHEDKKEGGGNAENK